MIELEENELTIKVTEEISWDYPVRYLYDRVLEDKVYDAKCENEELVQKYKELESDKLSHEDKAEIMDLIYEDMSRRSAYYDDELFYGMLCDWIEERSED